ncbi:MAG: peptidase MA family metallohydrolase [Candidatus Omnitrophica bacterium]|nr:peptidase MA family metallohydrolase [Candidatus Omnitrophota bacterium]
MKFTSGFILLFLLLANVSYAQVNSSLWTTRKSDHFVVCYQDAPLEYVDQILDKAEGYYNSITEELGFTRFKDFWTWDKRTRIYLYNSRADYQKQAKQPKWSAAGTNVISKQIYCFVNMNNFFDNILPHELGHIIFREFIGFERQLPLWFDEGLVSYLEKDYRQERLLIAKKLRFTRSFMTLDELSLQNKGNMLMPDIFYAEAASIFEYLVHEGGHEKLVEFCRHLRELRKDQDWIVALNSVYGFKDLAELDNNWQSFLVKSNEN